MSLRPGGGLTLCLLQVYSMSLTQTLYRSFSKGDLVRVGNVLGIRSSGKGCFPYIQGIHCNVTDNFPSANNCEWLKENICHMLYLDSDSKGCICTRDGSFKGDALNTTKVATASSSSEINTLNTTVKLQCLWCPTVSIPYKTQSRNLYRSKFQIIIQRSEIGQKAFHSYLPPSVGDDGVTFVSKICREYTQAASRSASFKLRTPSPDVNGGCERYKGSP